MRRKQTIASISPLSFVFFFALPLVSLSSAADTISSANKSLSGSQKLTSINGTFALGFFTPINSPSNNYYIGIWYNQVSTFTPVWVANRERPVIDTSSAEFKISDDGNLVLLQSKSIIWSSEANITSASTVAVLLDNGNLQLRDESNSSKIFWQSFDHPTDTWLPGAKLGFDKKTNKSQQLIAWKNSDDPASGIFSVELDPNGGSQYYILWNNSRKYWTSGDWNGRFFSLLPEMSINYLYNFNFVSNHQENYFTYSSKDNTILSRFVVTYSGQITQSTWTNSREWILFWSQPRHQCEIYAFCGPFGSCNEIYCNCMRGFSPRYPRNWNLSDRSGGCIRNAKLRCEQSDQQKVEQDIFYQMSKVRLPDNSQKSAVGSEKDCKLACLSTCSCAAFSYNDSGCLLYHNQLLNLQEQYNGTDVGTLHLRLAASELPSTESNRGKMIWIIISVIAGFVICLSVICVLLQRRKRRRRRRLLAKTAKAMGGTLTSFRYSELQHATRNFSEKLGKGGFGTVFKGSLPDSTTIAVKKLEGFHQGEKQFRAEVSTIGTIRHVNLVRLIGFCSERRNRLLVYEFMQNGSLGSHIFHNTQTVLDWKRRYQIAIGTARGLAYLHEGCIDCIIHCDIKPENILLDSSFVPKVADFGLAKLVGRDFSRVLTTMRGTVGYLAPEWISGLPITQKADVYSYGMMLLEIISGRRNSKDTGATENSFFPILAASKLVAGDVESLIDLRMNADVNLEELEKACKIAYWCIQDDENLRPTMSQVVQVLEGYLQVSMPPIPRSLLVRTNSLENMSSSFDTSTRQSSQFRSTASTSNQSKITSSEISND